MGQTFNHYFKNPPTKKSKIFYSIRLVERECFLAHSPLIFCIWMTRQQIRSWVDPLLSSPMPDDKRRPINDKHFFWHEFSVDNWSFTYLPYFEFVWHFLFQSLFFQTHFVCWIQNTNLRCLASSIHPPPCTVDFFGNLIYGSSTNFPYRGGNGQSWATVGSVSLCPTLPVLKHSYQIYFHSTPLTFPPLTCQMI